MRVERKTGSAFTNVDPRISPREHYSAMTAPISSLRHTTDTFLSSSCGIFAFKMSLPGGIAKLGSPKR